MWPASIFRSSGFTLAASMRTDTCPGPGSASGMFSSMDWPGWPNPWMRSAFIVDAPEASVVAERGKCAELQEQPEPVLQVPGALDSRALELMELVDAEADLLAGRGNAEQGPAVGAGDLGTNRGAVFAHQDVVDRDVHVGQRLHDAADDRLQALRPRPLAGGQRDVVPVGRDRRLQPTH